MPWPGVSWISEIFSRDKFLERAALTMALDKGWRLEEASDAPRVRANVSEIPSAVVIWVMAGLPSVRVPVLSTTRSYFGKFFEG